MPGGGTAGGHVTDTMRNADGRFGGRYFETSAISIPNGFSGVFGSSQGETSAQSPVLQGPQISEPYISVTFSLSKALGEHAGSEVAPMHVWQPHAIYLGLTV